MKEGAYDPYRFGERVEDGVKKYDAITYVFYFGELAIIVGLSEKLRVRHLREFIKDLHYDGVNTVIYQSKGMVEQWRLSKNVSTREVRAHYKGLCKRDKLLLRNSNC
tara:strand:+ start:903 stop:1223 length:321 start_codon:yes stop_codon:yes gene_type:complete